MSFLKVTDPVVTPRQDGTVPPMVTLKITGTGVSQTVAHGLKDNRGKGITPRTWFIQQFKGCDTIEVLTVDDANITVVVSDKGECSLALLA